MTLSPIPEVQAVSGRRDRYIPTTEGKFQSRTVCSICTKGFKQIPYVIPCGHSFHRSCLHMRAAMASDRILRCFECDIPFRREQVVPNSKMRDFLNDLERQDTWWMKKMGDFCDEVSTISYQQDKRTDELINAKDEEISRLKSEIVRLKGLFRPIEYSA